MEKWKEYRKGEIPKGNYKAKVICGDSNFLIIELRSKENRLILDFGITDAVRIFDRRLVDLDMYENIEGLKEDNFQMLYMKLKMENILKILNCIQVAILTNFYYKTIHYSYGEFSILMLFMNGSPHF